MAQDTQAPGRALTRTETKEGEDDLGGRELHFLSLCAQVRVLMGAGPCWELRWHLDLAALGEGDAGHRLPFPLICLRADAHNATLHNNLGFFLTKDGQLAKALLAINTARSHATEAETATILATRGFIAFREGDPNRGQQLYQEAIQLAQMQRDESAANRAQLYLARELILNHVPDGRRLLARMLETLGTIGDPDLAAVAAQIRRNVPAIISRNTAFENS